MSGLERSIQNAIRVRRDNLGPSGVTAFSVWIPRPVNEIVTALPADPDPGHRIIWEPEAEQSGSPSYSASAESGSPSGSGSATPLPDNRIYEYNGESWQPDPSTDPLIDALAVTVISAPAGENRIYIYSEAQNKWVDRTGEVNIEDGRFYTTWIGGKRYAYPTTITSILQIDQAGMYVVSDYLLDMPQFPGFEVGIYDQSMVEAIAVDGNNMLLRLFNLRTGLTYTRTKVGGVWGSWQQIAIEFPLPNSILLGGVVSYTGTGLTYNISPTQWRIDNVVFERGLVSPPFEPITLAPSNELYDRFDTFYVDNQGDAGVITGTPAADPVIPAVDPATQLMLTSVLVVAQSVAPTIPTGVLYDEGDPAEATPSAVGPTVNWADTTNPARGSIHADVGTISRDHYLQFTLADPLSLVGFDSLSFMLNLKEAMTTQHNLYLSWWSGATQVSNELLATIAKSATGSYQTVAHAITDWQFNTAGRPEITALRMRWSKAGANTTHQGFLLDYVKLEGGIPPVIVADTIELQGEVEGWGRTGTPVDTKLATPGGTATTLANADTFFVRVSGLLKSITFANIKAFFADILAFPADIDRYGFLNQTATTMAFDPATKIFTLADAGSGWSYYRAGIKCKITGNKTIDLTTVDAVLVDGALYFIYIDATDGTLSASRTAWTLQDTKVPVALLLWHDGMTPKYWIGEERHSCLIDRREHYREHHTEGTKPLLIGALEGYTLDSDVNANKVFSIGTSRIIDEDIIETLDQLAKPNGTNTDYVVFYRTDTDSWAWKASNMPFPYNVGNTNDWIQWDNNGVMTDATGGTGNNRRWLNSYLVLTNFAGAARFVFVAGQAIHTTLAAAQQENISAFTWGNFPVAEAVIVYRLTWSTLTSTSQGKCQLTAVELVVAKPSPLTVTQTEVDPVAMAAIGDRTYTEQNYITSSETITNSLNELDKALQAISPGPAGQTPELRVGLTHIQWKYTDEGEEAWQDLIAIADLTGADGTPGADGADGTDGASAFVYIAYASDDTGTDFTLTFDPALNYIAIKATTIEIVTPVVGDFAGLWKNYKGADGSGGGGGTTHYIAATPPSTATASAGQTWTDTTTARTYELWEDGLLKYWIERTNNKIILE